MALTKADIAVFKERLEKMRAQILSSLHGASESAKVSDIARGYSQHQADQGTDDFERTVSLELSSQEYHVLKQVERALNKIEEGTYGICDLTEKPIPKKRLDVIPYATMTVEAQEKMEKGLL